MPAKTVVVTGYSGGITLIPDDRFGPRQGFRGRAQDAALGVESLESPELTRAVGLSNRRVSDAKIDVISCMLSELPDLEERKP